MIQDCLRIFEKELTIHGDSLILDNYIPKDGTYILINMLEDSFQIEDPVNIFYDKKKGLLEGETNFNYRLIQLMDYYSKLVEMNKPIDPKKIIHSNNYLTLFVKKESLQSGKVTGEILAEYYKILENPRIKYEKKLNALHLYEKMEQELGVPDRECISKVQEWVSENIDNLGIDLTKKDYLKLFFIFPDKEKTKRLYQCEGKRYLLPNIFNNNDFNLVVENEIYGLPNDNMGMNAKKPYLENKSKKVKAPYMLGVREVVLQGKFFDYLMGKASIGYVNVYIDSEYEKIKFYKNSELPGDFQNGFYLRIQKGKEVEIHNMDSIVGYSYHLRKKFIFKEIDDISENLKAKMESKYGLKNNLQEIQFLIDDIFFNKFLINNYFTEAGKISLNDSVIKFNLLAAREKLFSWFYKNAVNHVDTLLETVSMNLIVNSINKNNGPKLAYQMNLRWSLMDYFGENDKMEDAIMNVRESLKNNILNQKEWELANDEEYYYVVGQLIQYYLKKTKSQKKELSIINPFIKAANDSVIKNRLMQMFLRVNHSIELKDTRIMALISHVVLYKPEGNVNKDLLVGGFTGNLLIYEKMEE